MERIEKLIGDTLKGNRLAVAKLISFIENSSQFSSFILDSLFPYMGKAYRVGITGPPGAGKSTIVDKLTLLLRQRAQTVGIIAVDPTSPFTGGALLGDRIRMQDLTHDKDVFIRSMATRGGLGGLANTTKEVADVLDAFGKDVILIETVGVGQSELDIAQAADTTVVVLVPESGDAIQAMKAGLMEIGNIFVVNKSDRESSERTVEELRTILEFKSLSSEDWHPPVLKVIATHNEGIDTLLSCIDQHRDYLVSTNQVEILRKNRIRSEIKDLLDQKLHKFIWGKSVSDGKLEELVEHVLSGKLTPYTAADKIFDELGLKD